MPCWMGGFEKYFGASRPEGAVPPPTGGGSETGNECDIGF